MNATRRQFGRLAGAAGISLAAPAVNAQGNPREVVFAMCSPISGPWAKLGELSVTGARFAVDEINAGGGIRALGGAQVRLVVVDSGDSPEKRRPQPSSLSR